MLYDNSTALRYSELAIAIFSLYVVIKYSQFKFNFTIMFKSLLASLIMGLVTYLLLDKINIILIIPLAGLIYLASLYLIKGITKVELKNFVSDES